MEEVSYQTQELDHLGIVAGVCNEIGLVKHLDSIMEHDGRKVTIGEAVQAMVLNALGFVSRPLYLTPEFFDNKPVEILIRPGLKADDLNEDSLGRALDALYAKGVTEVFAKVAFHALSVYGIEHDFYHLDSTSFSFHGTYERESTDEAIEITRGYSRDHRPDLKQAVLSIICSHKSSIPLWLEVHSGNEVDKTLFPKIIDAYVEQLEEGVKPCFIADSALYVEEHLQPLSEKVIWVTRVPMTIKEAKLLVNETDAESMEISEQEGYRLHEASSCYGNVEQRWLVVYSAAAYKRERATLQKRIDRELEEAQKAVWHLRNQEFSSKEDAEKVGRDLEKIWSYHSFDMNLEPIYRYGTRGRPKAGSKPTKVLWKAVGEPVKESSKVEAVEKTLGKFILATNQLDSEQMPLQKILDTYKSQTVSVERGFRFLKDPMFFADGFFLKKQERIMALLMVMGLSLLVYSLAERKLRLELARKNDSIPNQVGKPTKTPTMRRIFQLFQGIHVLLITEQGKTRQMVVNLKVIHRMVISLLGHEVEKCYFYNL